LQADLPSGGQARSCHGFCSPSGLFHLDNKFHIQLVGLGTVKTIYRDKKLSSVYRDWQKSRHRDAPPSSGQAPGI
jgi:hypothetical protein